MRLKEKWKKQDISTLPTNAINAAEVCNVDLLANVGNLLTILAPLSATTAVGERRIASCHD